MNNHKEVLRGGEITQSGADTIDITAGVAAITTNFGTLVRGSREFHRLTIKQFIEKLGNCVSSTYITKIERYGEIPSPKMVVKIVHVLNELNLDVMMHLARQQKIQKYSDMMNEVYK
jgi:hypothetical protein